MSDSPMPVPIMPAVSGATDVGRKRDHNEDSVLLCPHLHLFLLADGAGGHNAGEVASALATRSIANYFEATEHLYREKPEVDDFGLFTGARRLGAAVQKANRDIMEIANLSNQHQGMGTTIVAASISPRSGMLHIAHVGDSRCYRLRQGVLEQLTEDHSLIVDALELRPEIDDTALGRLPTNVITRALGMEPKLRVPVRSHEIVSDDRYLLCSDGLSNSLSRLDITRVLSEPETPDTLVSTLIRMANDAGGEDNVAVIVIACDEGAGRFPPERPSNRLVPRATSLGADDSIPEIMLIGIEEIDLDSNSGIHVLPKESASAGLLSAVKDFVDPVRQLATRGRYLEAPVCRGCKRPVENAFCPHCGAPRPEP